MLSDLHIDKFLRVSDLHLRNTVLVNYLVGPNGSGKSIILRYIFEKYEKSMWILDCGKNTEQRKVVLDNTEMPTLSPDDFDRLVSIYPKIAQFYETSGPERSGLDKLIKISKLIYHQITEHNLEFVLIEEPEIHLHPSLQKYIPEMLSSLAKHFGVQMFVETHSPFVVNNLGTDTEREESHARRHKHSFDLVQKAYFLDKGQIVDKKGVNSIKASYGYWGDKVQVMAAQMLGAGINDILPSGIASFTKHSPTLIFCEGQGRQEDEQFYNTVFDRHSPQMMFVSCRGGSQLQSTFQIMRQIKNTLTANFRLLMLRDRDHEFANEEQILEFEDNHKGAKVLRRRALECYIYCPETLDLIFEKAGMFVPHAKMQEMIDLSNQIADEAVQGIQGDSYKDRLKDVFFQTVKPLRLGEEFYNNPDIYIAKLVHPSSYVYQELEKILFS